MPRAQRTGARFAPRPVFERAAVDAYRVKTCGTSESCTAPGHPWARAGGRRPRACGHAHGAWAWPPPGLLDLDCLRKASKGVEEGAGVRVVGTGWASCSDVAHVANSRVVVVAER
eukprot:scaffold29133_cov135-Isochrysis_galbana.AAC.4